MNNSNGYTKYPEFNVVLADARKASMSVHFDGASSYTKLNKLAISQFCEQKKLSKLDARRVELCLFEDYLRATDMVGRLAK
jgi:hypothetical protein